MLTTLFRFLFGGTAASAPPSPDLILTAPPLVRKLIAPASVRSTAAPFLVRKLKAE